MPLQYTRTRGGRTDGQSYRQMAKQLTTIIEQELEQAGREGAAEAQGFIDVAGTQATWLGSFKGRTGPNAGRIDSGDMQDAIDYRITKGKDVGLDVGWPFIYKTYFGAQDKGFSAPGFRQNSQTVQGMGMLAHLSVYMRGSVDEALDRATERIVRGL